MNTYIIIGEEHNFFKVNYGGKSVPQSCRTRTRDPLLAIQVLNGLPTDLTGQTALRITALLPLLSARHPLDILSVSSLYILINTNPVGYSHGMPLK